MRKEEEWARETGEEGGREGERESINVGVIHILFGIFGWENSNILLRESEVPVALLFPKTLGWGRGWRWGVRRSQSSLPCTADTGLGLETPRSGSPAPRLSLLRCARPLDQADQVPQSELLGQLKVFNAP